MPDPWKSNTKNPKQNLYLWGICPSSAGRIEADDMNESKTQVKIGLFMTLLTQTLKSRMDKIMKSFHQLMTIFIPSSRGQAPTQK